MTTLDQFPGRRACPSLAQEGLSSRLLVGPSLAVNGVPGSGHKRPALESDSRGDPSPDTAAWYIKAEEAAGLFTSAPSGPACELPGGRQRWSPVTFLVSQHGKCWIEWALRANFPLAQEMGKNQEYKGVTYPQFFESLQQPGWTYWNWHNHSDDFPAPLDLHPHPLAA